MATDDKVYNDRGIDSSGTSSPQSPLSQAGGSSMPTPLGSVQTGFDAMSLTGSAPDSDD
jgi:hypothetical protein